VFYLSLPLPTAMLGSFRTRPNLGIALWSLAFTLLAIGITTSVLISVATAFKTYQALSSRDSDWQSLAEILLFSLLPWVLVAGTGIAIALINMRLEPLRHEAATVRESVDVLGMNTTDFYGVKVCVIPTEITFAFATTLSGKRVIVLSSGTKGLLSKEEFEAVMWHERTHIKNGHLLFRGITQRLATVIPWSWFAQCFRKEILVLSEIAADNKAVRETSSQALQSAKSKVGSVC
jgi:Zn-dependent protease with chaperone function